MKRLITWYKKPYQFQIKFIIKWPFVFKWFHRALTVGLIIFIFVAKVHAQGIMPVSAQAGKIARIDKPTTNIEGASNVSLFNKGGLSVSDPFTQAIKKHNAKIAHDKAVKKARLAQIAREKAEQKAQDVINTASNQTPVIQAPVMPIGSHTDWMAQAGIPQSDWGYVEWTVVAESGWNAYDVNPTSGACNLGQEVPCGKSGCALTDPVCELRWMNSYVLSRYNSWANEVAFHQANGWY